MKKFTLILTVAAAALVMVSCGNRNAKKAAEATVETEAVEVVTEAAAACPCTECNCDPCTCAENCTEECAEACAAEACPAEAAATTAEAQTK